MNEEVQIMGLREQGSAHHADHTDGILPDINENLVVELYSK